MSVEADLSISGCTVFVRLLDEGTAVYRPVRARPAGDGAYQLDRPIDYDPDNETWEFLPGSIVACESQHLNGETVPVAVRLCR